MQPSLIAKSRRGLPGGVQQQTKFDFVINLKTAKALGLAIGMEESTQRSGRRANAGR